MKLKKIAKRFAVALLAGVLMVTSMGMTASAATTYQTAINSVTITKTLTKASDVLSPAATFTFTVATAAADSENNILKGIDGAVIYTDASVTYSPDKSTDIGTTSIEKTTSLTFDTTKFSAPGIYHYIISESFTYDGVTNTTGNSGTLDLYVYVQNSENGSGYEVFAAVVSTTGTSKSISFTNDYGLTNGQVNDLTITKNVEGNQGDKSKDYSFTVKITAASGVSGEKYYLVVNNDTSNAVELSSGVEQTFTLKDGQSAVITGLSTDDTYEIYETNYTSEGYTTSAVVSVSGAGTVSKDADGKVSVTGSISSDTTVTYTNEKNVTTPTGLALTIAPYALMVVFAGVIAFLFLRKRKYDNDSL